MFGVGLSHRGFHLDEWGRHVGRDGQEWRKVLSNVEYRVCRDMVVFGYVLEGLGRLKRGGGQRAKLWLYVGYGWLHLSRDR